MLDCENQACPVNQKGRCFPAYFLGRQKDTLASLAYWQQQAEEESARRAPANLAPVTPEFMRKAYIADTLAVNEAQEAAFCRSSDEALREALRSFADMVEDVC